MSPVLPNDASGSGQPEGKDRQKSIIPEIEYSEGEASIIPHSEDSRKSGSSLELMLSMSSGPLPPPQVLKAYDLIEPGLAMKLFDMTQSQAQHRMELEKATIYGDGRRAWAGLIAAFTISMSVVGGGIYLISKGHDFAGTALTTTSLASLVGVFIYGTNQRNGERENKLKALLSIGKNEGSKE